MKKVLLTLTLTLFASNVSFASQPIDCTATGMGQKFSFEINENPESNKATIDFSKSQEDLRGLLFGIKTYTVDTSPLVFLGVELGNDLHSNHAIEVILKITWSNAAQETGWMQVGQHWGNYQIEGKAQFYNISCTEGKLF